MSFKKRLLLFFAVIGPGIIAASADNDAGGISTYSFVGSNFGYSLLWVLFLTTFSLAITQEMGARAGLVTGKGLAALIREHFGLKLTVFAMSVMLIANIGTISAEIAGIAAGLELLGVYKYVSVPLGILVIWFVLYKGSFRKAERLFLIFALFYIVYIISGFLVGADIREVLRASVVPTLRGDAPYLIALIATVGTTITPWGQFFIQSYVVDKGLTVREYVYEKIEVYAGAVLTNIISFFIIITTAETLFKHGIHIETASEAALALKPLIGDFAQELFAFGLLAASMLGAFILPVATSYALCEAFGFEGGFDRSWKEARTFYSIILIVLIIGALPVLIPRVSLIKIMLGSQVLNGILLPIILIYLMRIMNNKRIMGKYVNSRVTNIIGGATIAGLVATSVAIVFTSFV
ncbi:MAG: Mn transporter [Candidatus Jacksonbacteria bacterium RIFOXYA2_FULL_44_7]|uniref:Mn transporter n=1 Tax=Candidatus Jacksonbacteria bacterium RIFCSPLOWO2_02_FULL_44_20 TaxID=1798460 RepID=A0A1G2A6X9_9BACT|nr:MAG: Natural resistance-associated macrophage protein [Parcubacteria group bacterium GW2011_GWC2_44_17]KKT49621.1 MAG: Natural resistance-associated macrophage protein [Parcubacteria group bacterium GW2011_GWF2_44_17]OGY69557.1 MAG: Mn transporter [Candidatus Jacksonbacteria bacterium RIFCSPHIGHO2_02_FULL_44_25]OGY70037.1 MAG: Mn transporter [Candidatus Jacksonbacteria bacterium RIFCSPHIGHO2_12_FULL_44_12]OGY72638.1 MAG: Mn transporter [Candidatus Jacksonbacteria bacterium RIFCSPLOWO2_02_FUL